MSSKLQVHRIFNNRWYPVLIPVLIVVAAILIPILDEIVVDVWCSFFEGTVYGKVVMENGDMDPRKLENIEISWFVNSFVKQCKPIMANSKGEFRFNHDVPVGHPFSIKAKFEAGKPGYFREVRKSVDEIDGVRWFMGLPISSGIPRRVDIVIPDIPPPIFGN